LSFREDRSSFAFSICIMLHRSGGTFERGGGEATSFFELRDDFISVWD
jgi:hypothetical protein